MTHIKLGFHETDITPDAPMQLIGLEIAGRRAAAPGAGIHLAIGYRLLHSGNHRSHRLCR